MPRTRPNTSTSTPRPPPTSPSPPQSPASQPRSQRPTLNIPDLEAGCIVWLPIKDLHPDSNNSSSDGGGKDGGSIRCIRESCCGNAALEEKGYDHPVVVLKAGEYHLGDKICLIAMITSQPGNGRLARLPISQEAPLASPPLSTSNSNINRITTELYLEKGKMNKQSYILLVHIFELRASYLRSCSFRPASRSTDTRLREESHARLMSELRWQPGAWIPTAATVCAVSAPSSGPSQRSRTAESVRGARRGRAARRGRMYADAPAAVARSQSQLLPQTPQSARVARAVQQVPSRSAAAVEARVSSPVYTPYMHRYPLFGREAAPRMPGAWEDAEQQAGSGGRGVRDYGYGGVCAQGERSERWGSEPPRGEGEEGWIGLYFKVVVVSLTVVSVLWWRWRK